MTRIERIRADKNNPEKGLNKNVETEPSNKKADGADQPVTAGKAKKVKRFNPFLALSV
jgi:hypothetical protein